MPKRILVEHARDFTGGLNLATDPYDLADNEFPYAQNIDPLRRGGFSVRRGMKPYIATVTPLSSINTVYTHLAGATRHLLIAGNTATNGSVIYRWDGAAWQLVHAGYAGDNRRTIFVEMNDILYILEGTGRPVRKWTGTGLATEIAAPAFHDDIAAPTGATFIRGDVAAVHNGVFFVACLSDPIDGGIHLSRIRWSHPGKPEDWRTNDWIDIDPDDNAGQIRALMPLGDRLLVFKDRAVYAVHGYPPEGFSVTAITREAGAPSQQAVTRMEGIVFWWDQRNGLYSYNGRDVEWPFERLYPLLDDAKINLQFTYQAICQTHSQRVWISVPYKLPPYANTFVSLVFAPYVGESGAWTLHTSSLFSFWDHEADTGGSKHLVGGSGAYLYELDVENYYEDQPSGASASTVRIDAQLQTRWFDAHNPALRKRWKRPIVVVGADANQTFLCDVLDDYNPSIVRRSFQMFTDVNGTEGVWDVSDWDEVVWAAEIADRSAILRGSPLGTGTAKAIRFSNVSKGTEWRIHGLTMKWIPKRIRN